MRVVPGASARWGCVPRARRRHDAELREHRRLRRRGHDGRHVGDGRLVRADRQERAPLGRRRHRRRARAAAGGAGRGRGRLLHRLALHDRRRRPGAAAARCSAPGSILTGDHPGDRRRDRRGGQPRRDPRLVRSSCRPRATKEFPGGTFGLPCVLDPASTSPRASATTSSSSTTILREHGVARERRDVDLLGLTEELCAIPSVSGDEARARRPRRGAAARARAGARRRPGRRQRRRAHRARRAARASCSAATSTRCRRTATRRRAATATRCTGSARPT